MLWTANLPLNLLDELKRPNEEDLKLIFSLKWRQPLALDGSHHSVYKTMYIKTCVHQHISSEGGNGVLFLY